MQSTHLRKLLAAGGAAVVLGGSAFGIAAAQTPPAASPAPATGQQTQSPREQYVQALADQLGIPVDRLKQAMQAAQQKVGPAGFGGHADGMPGARGGVRGFLREGAQAAATALGYTGPNAVQELRTDVAGKTLAQLAQARGKNAQAVIDALNAAADQHIDAMASRRNLTAEQVNQFKQQAHDRTQQLVNTHQFPAAGATNGAHG